MTFALYSGHICISAIEHYTYKYIYCDGFAGIRLNDNCILTYPVCPDLFTNINDFKYLYVIFSLVIYHIMKKIHMPKNANSIQLIENAIEYL